MLSECAEVRRRGRALETWVASALAPRPPARLLGMGTQTFYLITALPPPRPPTRGPRPAQPPAPQPQCLLRASSAPANHRQHLARCAAHARLRPPAHPPTCPPVGWGSPSHALSPRCLAGQMGYDVAPPANKAPRGRGDMVLHPGDQRWHYPPWPWGHGACASLDVGCPRPLLIPPGKGTGARRAPGRGAAPHAASLRTLTFPASCCASPCTPGSGTSLLFVCYGFNRGERRRSHYNVSKRSRRLP